MDTYEESAKELKLIFPDGNYPSLKELKAGKPELTAQRDELKAELKSLSAEKRNMDIVWKNVQTILGTGHRIMAERPDEPPRNRPRRREMSL